MGIKLHAGFTAFTLVYLAGIYGLSSFPDHQAGQESTLVQLASNLLHIPLYAGLAFCVRRALLGDSEESLRLDVLTLLTVGAYAAVDEWHQSFVPGRYASGNDFILDLVGIVGMLLLLRARQRHALCLEEALDKRRQTHDR